MSTVGSPPRTEALDEWARPVSSLRDVSTARSEALGRLGIETLGNLLEHYPFRYIDLTATVPLGEVRPGTEVTAVGRVHEVRVKKPRPRLTIVEVAIVDGTGVLLGVWFNQSYMASRFVVEERVAFAGTAEREFGLMQMKSPFVEKLGAAGAPETLARILPVHRSTEGLSTNWLRRIVGNGIEEAGDVPDFLPVALRLERDLLPRRAALRGIHFPRTGEEREKCRKRLAYDELLCLQIGLALRSPRGLGPSSGTVHVTDGTAMAALREAIPFELTADQRRAAEEILIDMASARPMNRMLLGDVGTGKTVVAAHALAAAVDSGGQAAMMAPTEVLATQHAQRLGPLLDEAGISWSLLTGSTTSRAARDIKAALASGSVSVVFGTHALLEESVDFDRLTAVIVDEQHRFGVTQRLSLRRKGASPDLLVMTATPIPRSLALTLYGDLDTSYLRVRPTDGGGHRIVTEIVDRAHEKKAYEHVREAIRSGSQAYVICALVDESDAAEAKAAVSEAERLKREVFPDLRVGLLTGKMRPAEKAAVMIAFRDGELDILVATTVVEVGVDVGNASVMIVENAERFGLAQLHQLRGRIGRSGQESRFMMFAEPRSRESKERMRALVESSDGFELAEIDMRLRGEGQLLGERQHGLPELRLASLMGDQELAERARADARGLIEEDPGLCRPEHLPLASEVRRRFGSGWQWVSSG